MALMTRVARTRLVTDHFFIKDRLRDSRQMARDFFAKLVKSHERG